MGLINLNKCEHCWDPIDEQGNCSCSGRCSCGREEGPRYDDRSPLSRAILGDD